jgi:ribonuclease T2
MKDYWVDIHGRNEQFWEHEWSTHGTCYSTLQPSCLPPNSPEGAEAVLFFQRVVSLFQTLPTYDWLASQGITPNREQTYALSDIVNALQTASGHIPEITCSGKYLNQISWYFNLQGSLVDGQFLPIDAPIDSKCPSSGIKYVPKN